MCHKGAHSELVNVLEGVKVEVARSCMRDRILILVEIQFIDLIEKSNHTCSNYERRCLRVHMGHSPRQNMCWSMK